MLGRGTCLDAMSQYNLTKPLYRYIEDSFNRDYSLFGPPRGLLPAVPRTVVAAAVGRRSTYGPTATAPAPAVGFEGLDLME